jgi:hypothetical protein
VPDSAVVGVQMVAAWRHHRCKEHSHPGGGGILGGSFGLRHWGRAFERQWGRLSSWAVVGNTVLLSDDIRQRER